MLQVGDQAPDFRGKTSEGYEVSPADFRGRKLVLYFYPMDDTPGCTAQACSLRDHHGALLAAGVSVLGVSAQGITSHLRFRDKYQLNFPLVADSDRRIARAYGALGEGLAARVRALLGLLKRVTYIIDEHGRIAHRIDRPDCPNHAAEVLRLLEDSGQGGAKSAPRSGGSEPR